jgi:hypothetical protein
MREEKPDPIQRNEPSRQAGASEKSASPPITPTASIEESSSPSLRQPTRLEIARRIVRSPLLLLWVLGGVALVGGIVEWLFLDGLPWEGLGAAGVIAGVTKLAARARGVPAWPWQDQP